MRALDIALKDMLRSFRSMFAVVMIFAAPLLIAGLIALAFGGVTGEDGGFDLPVTEVVVANLDQPNAQAGVEAGQMLADFLHSETLGDFLHATDVTDAASARAVVDRQEAGVAVIIPADFTSAALGAGQPVTVTLYRDPVLTIGPAIVQQLVTQFTEGFAGAQIAASVVTGQLRGHGVELNESARQQIALQYARWAQASGESRAAGQHPALDIRAPAGTAQVENVVTALMGPIMAGQLIFFAFFTGAQTAESIIREDEEGTLSRLFATPTPISAILTGKFISVFLMLLVESVVLLGASRVLFSVRWGQPAALALVVLGLIVAAAGFGVMMMSFLKNTRQTGVVLGGVLTFVGMLGGLFTTGIPNLPAAFQTVTLFTPHGWALRGMKAVLAGGTVPDVLLPFTVTVVMGVVCFAIGLWFFRKRFA